MMTYDALPEPHHVGAGRATAWFSGGWKLFMAAPVLWLAIGVVCFLHFALFSIPGPGSLLATVLYPLLAAGLMECARVISDGGELEIGALFAGFRRHTGNLLVTGLLLAAGSMISFALWGIIVLLGGGMSALSALQNVLNNGLVNTADLIPFANSLLLALLVMLLLMTLLTMAAWFAPALVLFDGMTPLAALKSSFAACLRSWLALTLFSLLAFVLISVAIVAGVVGFLVAAPLVASSVYLSYREIFH